MISLLGLSRKSWSALGSTGYEILVVRPGRLTQKSDATKSISPIAMRRLFSSLDAHQKAYSFYRLFSAASLAFKRFPKSFLNSVIALRRCVHERQFVLVNAVARA